jgi:CBS domain-containing protein
MMQWRAQGREVALVTFWIVAFGTMQLLRNNVSGLREAKVLMGDAVSRVADRTALTPDVSLTAALKRFLRENITALPVTSGAWRTTLLGEVLRHDLLRARQDRMSDKRSL